MPKAIKIIISPIRPLVKIFFALPSLSSFPAEVIHIKPPYKTMQTAIIPKNPKAILIIFVATTLGSPASARAIFSPTTSVPKSCAKTVWTNKRPPVSRIRANINLKAVFFSNLIITNDQQLATNNYKDSPLKFSIYPSF